MEFSTAILVYSTFLFPYHQQPYALQMGMSESYTDNQCRTYKHGSHMQPRPTFCHIVGSVCTAMSFSFREKPVHYL